jgi:hypothetical protein
LKVDKSSPKLMKLFDINLKSYKNWVHNLFFYKFL